MLDVVEGDALTEATLAVLAVLAFTMIRERTSRQHFVTGAREVQDSVARIEESVSSLRLGTPYRILKHEVAWDLVTADGSFAVGSKRKRLRFLQNNIVSLSDYVQTDGRVSNVRYSPGKKADSFIVGARRYDLISLGRLFQAGDEIDFNVEREVHNSFREAQEHVAVEILDPTEVLVIRVTWPADRPPNNVRLEHVIDQRPTSRDIDAAEFQRLEDGRTVLSQTIEHPPEDAHISLWWDW